MFSLRGGWKAPPTSNRVKRTDFIRYSLNQWQPACMYILVYSTFFRQNKMRLEICMKYVRSKCKSVVFMGIWYHYTIYTEMIETGQIWVRGFGFGKSGKARDPLCHINIKEELQLWPWPKRSKMNTLTKNFQNNNNFVFYIFSCEWC